MGTAVSEGRSERYESTSLEAGGSPGRYDESRNHWHAGRSRATPGTAAAGVCYPTLARSSRWNASLQPIFCLADSQLLFWRHENGSLGSKRPWLRPLGRRRLGPGNGEPLRAAYVGASNGDEPAFYSIFAAAMEGVGVTEHRMVLRVRRRGPGLAGGGRPGPPRRRRSGAGLAGLRAERHAGGDRRPPLRWRDLDGDLRRRRAARWLGPKPATATPSTFRLVPAVLGAHDEESDWRELRRTLGASGRAGAGDRHPHRGRAGLPSGRPGGSIEPVRHPLHELIRGRGRRPPQPAVSRRSRTDRSRFPLRRALNQRESHTERIHEEHRWLKWDVTARRISPPTSRSTTTGDPSLGEPAPAGSREAGRRARGARRPRGRRHPLSPGGADRHRRDLQGRARHLPRRQRGLEDLLPRDPGVRGPGGREGDRRRERRRRGHRRRRRELTARVGGPGVLSWPLETERAAPRCRPFRAGSAKPAGASGGA